MKLSPRFFKKWFSPLRRLYLFLKPAYWRLRTPSQKKFDIHLQYIFIGCCIGVLFVASIIPAANKLIYYSIEKKDTSVPSNKKESVSLIQEETSSQNLEKKPEKQLLFNIEPGKIKTISLALTKGETLSGLLKRADISMKEALQVSKALELVLDIRKLRPEQVFELYFSEDNSFYGLSLELRHGDLISVFKDVNGVFIPQAKEGKIVSEMVQVNGTINTSFAQAADDAGLPKAISLQVIRALDGEIDFRTDLKKGAPFSVIYEKKITETGREVGKSILQFVSLAANNKTYNRYYFVDAAGNPGFYNEYGESAPKTLMKRPLGRGRISSPFGIRRHPILKYQIHHSGTDFPAPLGTPIPAGGDGIIVQKGWNGAYGKYIKIKHTKTYSTAYGHMSRFNDDFHVGSFVKRGEIIGYVGSTGRSTGPHLHYEVIKNGKQVNPLKTYTIPKRSLKGTALTEFKEHALQINPDYQDPLLEISHTR